MMGSGKSTLGDALGKKLGYRFLDTDEIAEFMVWWAHGGRRPEHYNPITL
jgi:cytidylate kinase